ncbi:hypothetical protein T12_2009 [Trichinella patagoniensis]|uniref:Integrase p58-like C-terminal domain-containing protein n=1 Tax=Trichinella patagoniensis TaxID=990121 RepID=A0A0V0ZR72_9BILA|nr:hypothetical protein T12_2009 [Trichinella patagoniensis]
MQRSTRTWGTLRPPASTSKSWQPTSETCSRLPESSAAQQMRQRYYYDRKTGNPYYETHEAVWLYCPASKSRPSRKFTTPWTGPFKIVKQVSRLDYRIRSISNPRRTLLVHVNRLKPCKLTSAQLCSLRQKDNEDKKQVRRDHQSKTKPRIYRPRLVWTEEDHGRDGTSAQAMVAPRPQRESNPMSPARQAV